MGISSYTGGTFTQYEQGEYVFSIRQFTPFYAMKVLGELQKIATPILGGAVQAAENVDTEAEIRSIPVLTKLVSGAVNGMANKVDGETLERIAKLLLDPNYVSVAPIHTKEFQRLDEAAINEVFSGRVIDMIALMMQVAKINYLDFSKLCSVPTGAREVLAELKQSFRVQYPTTSEN